MLLNLLNQGFSYFNILARQQNKYWIATDMKCFWNFCLFLQNISSEKKLQRLHVYSSEISLHLGSHLRQINLHNSIISIQRHLSISKPIYSRNVRVEIRISELRTLELWSDQCKSEMLDICGTLEALYKAMTFEDLFWKSDQWIFVSLRRDFMLIFGSTICAMILDFCRVRFLATFLCMNCENGFVDETLVFKGKISHKLRKVFWTVDFSIRAKRISDLFFSVSNIKFVDATIFQSWNLQPPQNF